MADLNEDQRASMMGSSPSWLIYAERAVSRGWIRSQATACAIP
jgi:hypothetical protein